MATRDLNSKAEYKYKINNVIYLHIRVIHAKFFHVIYSSYSKANKSDVITKKKTEAFSVHRDYARGRHGNSILSSHGKTIKNNTNKG